MDKINEIKWQPDNYITAADTKKTQKEAIDGAQEFLGHHIKTWLRENEIEPTEENVARAANFAKHIEAPRGSLCYVFLYILKEDLRKEFGIVLTLPEPTNSKPIIPTPTGPVNTDPTPTRPISTDPVLENVGPDDDAIDNNIPDDGVMDEGLDEGLDVTILTPIEEEMLNVKAEGIGAFIKKLESEYKLSRYGKYADMPADINCYLFVYDRTKTIVAYLRKEGDIYINLQNGTMDDIQNYKGCGAIWFRIKNY
jgi:hypothetical protein